MNKDLTIYERNSPKGIIKEKPISSSTRLIIEEATKLGIKSELLECTNLFKLTYKDKIRYFFYQNPGTNTSVGMYITNDKRITKNLLSTQDISVPKGYAIAPGDSHEYWKDIFDSLKKPLVVKPTNGSYGNLVSVDINTLFDYIFAVRKAFNYSGSKKNWVMVEEELTGFKEYRILATKEKVIGIIRRVPANVVGDGISNIRKLIKIKNSDPRRKDPEDHPPLFKIQLDEDMKSFLLKQGLTWKSIPKKGEQIFLRGVSNISQGADSIDYTDKVHSSVKDIALKVMSAIPGLVVGGIDFMTKDITKAQSDSTYGILEVNNSPGIDIHDYPYEGQKRNAAIEFLRSLFGEL